MAGPRTTEDKYALGGIAVGLAVAAIVAIVFAYDSTTIVRYFIMATGLVVGWVVGRAIGRAKAKGE